MFNNRHGYYINLLCTINHCLCLAKTDEPPLQHRKRTTLSSLALEGSKYQDDDYFLVGDQAKFAPSIPYRSRSVDRKAWILAKVTNNSC